VRETAAERLKRERALADAVELADSSRAWKVRLTLCLRIACMSLQPQSRHVIIIHGLYARWQSGFLLYLARLCVSQPAWAMTCG
jgi:hypothetical protein